MSDTDHLETEVLVVGGGPGGYVAAIRAGQLGLEAVLVDERHFGGTCLNAGCIPSKALITAAETAHAATSETAESMGIYGDVSVAFDELVDWKDGVVDQLTGGVEKLCKANRVGLREARAAFTGEHTARLTDDGETVATVEFDHAVVATGSRPLQVPGFDFSDDPVLDSRQVLALEERPDELVVVGAGYIGMELSTMFAKLGTDVTVIEMLDDVLPGYEDDVARTVRKRAVDLGVEFAFGQAASGWERTDGTVTVTAEDEQGTVTEYGGEYVLVAVGRRPVTDTVNLAAIGLETDDDGFLPTDEQCRTDLDHVYAVGDVAGEPMLAHKASMEGLVAAETISGTDASTAGRAIPAVVFTDPEVGTVGLSATEAEREGVDHLVGEFPMYASGRALTLGETDGFVRVVAEADSGRLLGATVVGPEASELLGELALAVEQGLTVDDIGETVHSHPTLSEATMEAAENARDRAIHTLNR
jgi:dihydrolipoamide dehydrogenase